MPARPLRPTSDREVPIVPEGEPAGRTDPWVRFRAAIAARRRVGAPPGLPQRIMQSIGELPAR